MTETQPFENRFDLLSQINSRLSAAGVAELKTVLNLLDAGITGPEKRKSPRKPIRTTVDFVTNDAVYADAAHNFSQDGIFIETTENIAVGDDISLFFTFSENNDPVKILGTVVRRDKNGIAVQFGRNPPEIAFFKGWLAGINHHLCVSKYHDTPLCNLRPNGFVYADTEDICPISVETAFEEGWIRFDRETRRFSGNVAWDALTFM